MEDQKRDVKSDEVVGYVHNVFPVKSGRQFHFQLQTQERTVKAHGNGRNKCQQLPTMLSPFAWA